MTAKQRYDQFLRDLNADVLPQRQWSEGRGLFLIVGHFLVGCASGSWLLARYYGVTDAMVLAVVLGALGGLAHLINLGHPERALRMMVKVKTSWIARGFWGLTFLLLGGVLYLAPRLIQGSPWGTNSPVALAGDILALFGAFILVAYMGTAYMVSKSVAFWNSKLHPLVYAGYSARGGAASLILVSAWQSRSLQSGIVQFWMAATALVVILWVIDLKNARSHGFAAQQSVRYLLAGRLSLAFYGGALVLGIILPALLIASQFAIPSYGSMAIAGLASLIGDFFMKYSSVKGGVHKRVRVVLDPALVTNANDQAAVHRIGALSG